MMGPECYFLIAKAEAVITAKTGVVNQDFSESEEYLNLVASLNETKQKDYKQILKSIQKNKYYKLSYPKYKRIQGLFALKRKAVDDISNSFERNKGSIPDLEKTFLRSQLVALTENLNLRKEQTSIYHEQELFEDMIKDLKIEEQNYKKLKDAT